MPCSPSNPLRVRCFAQTPLVSCAHQMFAVVVHGLCRCIYIHAVTVGLLYHRNLCAASATVSTPAPAAAAAPAHQQEAPVLPFRVGYGFDLHRLVEGKKLIICGVDVPHVRGCDAHSDGMSCFGPCQSAVTDLLCKTCVQKAWLSSPAAARFPVQCSRLCLPCNVQGCVCQPVVCSSINMIFPNQ